MRKFKIAADDLSVGVLVVRIILIACATSLFVGSCATPKPTSGPTMGVSSTNMTLITKRLQNSWARCLEQSYGVNSARMPDKNAAAEMSFQACASEERDLAGLPYSNLLMPHLRAETKHVLIDEGRLPRYPEQ
jgi:hypothetical protein